MTTTIRYELRAPRGAAMCVFESETLARKRKTEAEVRSGVALKLVKVVTDVTEEEL